MRSKRAAFDGSPSSDIDADGIERGFGLHSVEIEPLRERSGDSVRERVLDLRDPRLIDGDPHVVAGEAGVRRIRLPCEPEGRHGNPRDHELPPEPHHTLSYPPAPDAAKSLASASSGKRAQCIAIRTRDSIATFGTVAVAVNVPAALAPAPGCEANWKSIGVAP